MDFYRGSQHAHVAVVFARHCRPCQLCLCLRASYPREMGFQQRRKEAGASNILFSPGNQTAHIFKISHSECPRADELRAHGHQHARQGHPVRVGRLCSEDLVPGHNSLHHRVNQRRSRPDMDVLKRGRKPAAHIPACGSPEARRSHHSGALRDRTTR